MSAPTRVNILFSFPYGLLVWPRDPFKEIRDRKMKDFIDFKWVSCVDSYLLS